MNEADIYGTTLSLESIKVIAESIGIANLPDEAAKELADDVSYRLKLIVQSIYSFLPSPPSSIPFLTAPLIAEGPYIFYLPPSRETTLFSSSLSVRNIVWVTTNSKDKCNVLGENEKRTKDRCPALQHHDQHQAPYDQYIPPKNPPAAKMTL
uniref:(California timema) hypothetical protein n=1 Tax=Timema californicum TaxID=61474 RepID=A0A7R9IZ90_TIMCA|nr:unnamed protein product [Timema californicum]